MTTLARAAQFLHFRAWRCGASAVPGRGIFFSLRKGLMRRGAGRGIVTVAVLGCIALGAAPRGTGAQETAPPADPQERYAQAMADDEPTEAPGQVKVSLLAVLRKGGPLMIPIAAMSVVVVAIALERAWALRASRVLPPGLVQKLGELSLEPSTFDPKAAYRVCQQYPSAAATVLRAMILKAGRPLVELERAVAQASQREATRMYAHVRTINLATAVCPLLGLLGTVQGMIAAFFITANLPTGADRLSLLADGIYLALATTFAGLSVAIPSSLLAHYFEGLIQRQFLRIEELAETLEPHLERFEGRLRRESSRSVAPHPAPKPPESARPAAPLRAGPAPG